MAEGGGLLNRRRFVKTYRGFVSLYLRHSLLIIKGVSGPIRAIPLIIPFKFLLDER